MTRPKNVRLFEGLMYGSIGIGMVSLPFRPSSIWQEWRAEVGELAPGMMTFVAGIVFAMLALAMLPVWLAARRRKNWARWFMGLFIVLSMPGVIGDVVETWRTDVVNVVVQLVTSGMQLAAMYFVYSGDAREWFRPHDPDAVAAEFS